jgi:hypothetical protein
VDTPASASKKALTVYRAMWTAFQKAQSIPDPTFAALAQNASGDALSTLTTGIAETKKDGLKGTGRAKLSPQIYEIAPAKAPTTVKIRDCLDTRGTHLVKVKPGGKPYHDPPGGLRLTLATIARGSDGVWKVIDIGVRDVGTC